MSCFSGTFSTFSHFPSIRKTNWVLDTGVTHHICPLLSSFKSHEPTCSIVTLPNNSIVHATHVGSVQISPDLILQNVLCVPLFHFNLLSISSLTQQLSCSVFFLSDFCKIQALNKNTTIGMGRRVGNLYILNTSGSSTVCMLPPINIPYGIVGWVIHLCLNLLFQELLFTLIPLNMTTL